MTQLSRLFLSFLVLSRVFDVFILMEEEDNEFESLRFVSFFILDYLNYSVSLLIL